MRCDTKNEDPRSLYEDYIRDLILVARCGKSDTRYLFLLGYAEQLYGLSNYLAFLAEREQRAVFDDALRSWDGDWPRSFAGMRLAAPPWFRRRVSDPLGVWRASESYSPDRLEIDPICGMIVDPSETPYVSRRNGVDVYFCCPACLERFEQRVDGMALPLHPAAESYGEEARDQREHHGDMRLHLRFLPGGRSNPGPHPHEVSAARPIARGGGRLNSL